MFILAAQLEGAFWKEEPEELFPELNSTWSKTMEMSWAAAGGLAGSLFLMRICDG